MPERKRVLTSEDRAVFPVLLEGAAADPSLAVIANRFPWQTKMAIDKLLEVAVKRRNAPIRLLTGGGPEGFYDERLAARFRTCKEHGSPFIRVLVWQKSAEGISQALLNLVADKTIELRVSGTDQYADEVPHFLLIGDDAYRQEAAHPRFTCSTVFGESEPQIPARIDFGDPEGGQVLKSVFDQVWGPA